MTSLQNGLQLISKHKGSVAAGVGLGVVSAGVGTAIYLHKNKKRSKKSKRSSSKKTRKRKQRKPYTAGKRKDRSHKRIRFTKRGQPYIITADGRAKFIKMSSVKRSRKRKGGKY